ncbi:chromate resistance protein ChrB domain-containing protein [Deferrisoma sp.]
MRKVLAALCCLVFSGMAGSVLAQPRVFWTWENFEADKCASVWLIKRFIAPEAEIRIIPRGGALAGGIPFDVPAAKFKRYATRSTYATLLEHYGVDDPVAERIRQIIHDIEINTWDRKRFQETHKVMKQVRDFILENRTHPKIIMERCVDYFDALYEKWGEPDL